ncbi:GNAT family N-acetyltransferase [Xanthomonas sacchari]|uniref:GNAT family N-acetyltransferase n=1 Tax=Xanthomonas sacchari TaxID=56458 RepID=UPI00225E4CBB|nr:GNAT family N-acetyltransferase [Xanthomonas sacchari]
MQIRPATLDDAEAMVAVQTAIFAAGLRKAPTDLATVRATYLQHPDRLQCVLAEDADGRVLGFQSLRIARPGNAYDVAEGWGIIGTHVDPRAARRGIGSALFRPPVRPRAAPGWRRSTPASPPTMRSGRRTTRPSAFAPTAPRRAWSARSTGSTGQPRRPPPTERHRPACACAQGRALQSR